MTRFWFSACHHIGARACRLTQIEDHVKLALKERWKTFLLGDLIDNGVSGGSKHMGLEWQNTMTPGEQIELVADTFAPLAKAGLIVGVWGGNHAYRTVRVAGIHPEKVLATLWSGMAGGLTKPHMPWVVQKLNELSQLTNAASSGGARSAMVHRVAAELQSKLGKWGPGSDENAAVPFFLGLGHVKVDGVPVIAHHGVHPKSRQNWDRLERAARGYRVFATAHNHTLSHEYGLEEVRGKFGKADFISAGTYQGFEEYAQIAMYPARPTGSVLAEYDRRRDYIRTEFLV